MRTDLAFALGEANRHKEMKIFDWDKAARRIKEEKPDYVMAGLIEDWEYTADVIYEKGKIKKDNYCFLGSTWATPTLEMDGTPEDCFVMAHETKWHAETKWPKSAIDILEQEE